MEVKAHPEIAEIIGKKLLGIEGVPTAEQTKMVRRAVKASIEYVEPLESHDIRNLKFWCALCQKYVDVRLDGDICCKECGLIITSYKKGE